MSSEQAIPPPPETTSYTPRKTSLALRCSNWDCQADDAWPVRNADGVWIQKIWACNTCGHLFRIHEVWFEGRRCADILDRKKRI